MPGPLEPGGGFPRVVELGEREARQALADRALDTPHVRLLLGRVEEEGVARGRGPGGVRETAAGALYRLGLALLDLESPERVLLRSDEWVFGPRAEYERVGDVADVVFPCGATVAPDGDTLFLYYGGADTVMCLATACLQALLRWLKDHGRPGGLARDE